MANGARLRAGSCRGDELVRDGPLFTGQNLAGGEARARVSSAAQRSPLSAV
jgi:hypothetical protein